VTHPVAKPGRTGAQVFVIPAETAQVDGRRIYFLFSIFQVAEVLKHVDVLPVPFGPSHVEGIGQWCGRVLPVLSLERLLGLPGCEGQMPQRCIVLRSVARDAGSQPHELYVICRVAAAIRHMALDDACIPAAVPDWVCDASYLHGVYSWRESLLMVINLEEVLKSERFEKHYVSKNDHGKRYSRGD
jgi:chemotaxis signal transduction protein